MAVITVTTSADVIANDGLISLREAIEAANSGDVITFGATLSGQSIRLGSVLTVATGENFTIQGDIDRNGTADITIDGQNATRLMNVQVGATVALDTIVLANGSDVGTPGGAGFPGLSSFFPSGAGFGGGNGGAGGNAVAGILNEGVLTLTRVLFSGNSATGGTGGDGGNGGAGGAGLAGSGNNGGPGGAGGAGGAGGLAASAVFNSAGAQLTLIDSAWVNQTINYGEGGKGGNGGTGGAGGSDFGFLSFGGNGGAGGAGGNEGAQGSGGAIVNLGNVTVSGAVAGFGSIINVGSGRGAGAGGAGGAPGSGFFPGLPGPSGSAGNEAPLPVLQPEIFNTGAGTVTGFSTLSSSLVYLAAPILSQAEGSDGGATNYTFTVTRLGNTSTAASVAFSVTGGTADSFDFSGGVVPSGTVNFAANQSSATFTIGVVQDQVIEADETFNVSITNPSSGLTIGAGSSLTATITNDDVKEIFTISAKKPVTIIDNFDSGVDEIHLEDSVFKGLLGNGALKGKSFAANEDGEATKARAQIIYDTDNGRLLYDRDGIGGKKAVHFATLEGSPDLSRFDFDLI